MNIKEIKKGFSLIEISVVLLIVAIFVAAISSGKLFLDKSNEMRIEQGVKKALQSQEYYEDLVFSVVADGIEDKCGKDANFLQITDYLNTKNCCDASNNGSLCCKQGASCECGNDNSGSCFCNSAIDQNHPDCP
jgi:prepilin-type N-terminal cleavage/methylation domain-containing protein